MLDIVHAETHARLIGSVDHAGAVERRLSDMLRGPVSSILANGADMLGQDQEIIRIPRLVVRLRLTRAELESGRAATDWAAAIIAGFGDGERHSICRFANRRAFHAAYLRHRFGVEETPAATFAEFTTLNLISPVQAIAEMLRSDPALWTALARPGKDDAVALIQALAAQGSSAATYVLQTVGRGPAGQRDTRVLELHKAICEQLVQRLPDIDWPRPAVWAGLSGDLATFLAAILAAPSDGENAVETGRVLAVLIAVLRRSGIPAEMAIGAALGAVGRADKTLAKTAQVLARAVASSPALRRRIVALLGAVAKRGAFALQTRAKTARSKGNRDTAAMDQTDGPARQTEKSVALRRYTSPFAGVALVLPLLTERGIGRAFPAQVRLQALADLVRCDGFETPEDSAFLAALTGMDQRDKVPDRPDSGDFLLIAADRHSRIHSAVAGAPRLARWLEARFAGSLPSLQSSSLRFLQRQFFHVPGEMWIDDDTVTIRIDPMPLLAVLQMAGRIDPDPVALDWLGNRQLLLGCEGSDR
jgi:hypothetical protein